MNWFKYVFSTFMDLERGNVIAPYVGLTETSDFNKNISICVINDRIFIFGWTNPLSCYTMKRWNYQIFKSIELILLQHNTVFRVPFDKVTDCRMTTCFFIWFQNGFLFLLHWKTSNKLHIWDKSTPGYFNT